MTIPLHSRPTANPRPFRTPPRFSSSRCSFALITNFAHSSLRVFRDLCTLSFSGSQLSRVFSAVCALFRKKPGVHPSIVMPGSAGILPASVPDPVRSRRIPALCKHGAGWASPSPTKTANHGPRFSPSLVAARRPLATSYISFISPAYEHRPRISLVSPTYAKTGGWTPAGSKTLKLCLKCRRADIPDFSPDISHFLTSDPLSRPCSPRVYPPQLQWRRATSPSQLRSLDPFSIFTFPFSFLSAPSFPPVFLSPPKFVPKLPPISQYTALTGPLFP
jgi:hypothetical protein